MQTHTHAHTHTLTHTKKSSFCKKKWKKERKKNNRRETIIKRSTRKKICSMYTEVIIQTSFHHFLTNVKFIKQNEVTYSFIYLVTPMRR